MTRTTPPLLPELAALTDDDSMLTRRFGREVVNYFAGSPLNRYSFLRTDAPFLQRAAASPAARFIALHNLNPLVADKRKLALFDYEHVRGIVGEELFRSSDEDRVKSYDSTASALAGRPLVVFLGTVEGDDDGDVDDGCGGGGGSRSGRDGGAGGAGDDRRTRIESSEHGQVKGRPYFAVDVSTQHKGRQQQELLQTWIAKQEGMGLWVATDTRSLTLHSEAGTFIFFLYNPAYIILPSVRHGKISLRYNCRTCLPNLPSVSSSLPPLLYFPRRWLLYSCSEKGWEGANGEMKAAMFAQARSILDWNSRNRFCAGCGRANLSVSAGYKRVCPPTDRAAAEPLPDCPTRHGVSNICFPRTDPTMIAAVVSADGQRILLGRQSRWAPHLYSALAGFLEPGESLEEAVRREVWEEAGVRVGRVVVHSTQPWPYPASLMIGAVAQALPGEGESISLNDKELESARWFTLEEVRAALARAPGALGAPPPADYQEGSLRVPPPQAIANRLMAAVVEGFLTTGGAKI